MPVMPVTNSRSVLGVLLFSLLKKPQLSFKLESITNLSVVARPKSEKISKKYFFFAMKPELYDSCFLSLTLEDRFRNVDSYLSPIYLLLSSLRQSPRIIRARRTLPQNNLGILRNSLKFSFMFLLGFLSLT